MGKTKLEKLVFKKIELWVLLLICLLMVVGSVLFSHVTVRTLTLPEGAPYTSQTALHIASLPGQFATLLQSGIEVNKEGKLAQRNPQLADFPYFQGYKEEEDGFRDEGLLLVSAYSRTHGISTVYLYDLGERRKLWEWVPDYEQIFAKTPSILADIKAGKPVLKYNLRENFRTQHPYLLEDGSVIASSGEGLLFRMDRRGDIIWTSDRHYHHSIERLPDGNFIVPIVYNENAAYRDDGYAIVSPEGQLLDQVSVTKILTQNGYRGLLLGVGLMEKDRLHLNDVEPIRESDEFVKKGDLMMSVRHLSTAFLYRPSTGKIIWLKTGPWLAQHDIDYQGDGIFTIFGNDIIRGDGYQSNPKNNKIYTYNMATDEVGVLYGKIFAEKELLTPTQGLARVLRNGDAFVSLTDKHQLLRVSEESIRWRYTNPVGENLVGALHWSRYFYRDELKLGWLEQEKQSNLARK